jgi:hypothetical protein
VLKALAPPTLELAVDDYVGVVFDPQRLHVIDETGAANLSAAGAEGVFRVERGA